MAKKTDAAAPDMLTEAKELATLLKSEFSERDKDLQAIRDMYMCLWDEEDKFKQTAGSTAKATIDPTPRIKGQGAIRLLTATRPKWGVPFDQENDKGMADKADKLKKFCRLVWDMSSRVWTIPLETEGAINAILAADVHWQVIRVKDLITAAGEKHKARVERIARFTSHLVQPLNPLFGYPLFDKLGLVAYLQEEERAVADVISEWPGAEEKLASKKLTDKITYKSLWRLREEAERVVWCDGVAESIYQGKLGIPFIPIIAQIVDGSRMFHEPHYQRQGLLYTLYKTGLSKRMNLSLSVLYTLIFAMGVNPLMLWESDEEGVAPPMDYSKPGGVTKIKKGDKYTQQTKQVIDPSLMTGMEVAQRKAEESTIYGSTLGEPVAGGNAPFSLQALLNQAGRLPLTAPKLLAGNSMARAMEMVVEWIKLDKEKVKVSYGGVRVELDTEFIRDLPDDLMLECNLDIALAQDKMQLAQIAERLTQGENPLASMEYVREDIMDMEDSDDEQGRIWSERSAMTHFAAVLQAEVQRMLTPPAPPETKTVPSTPPSPPTPPTPPVPPRAPGEPPVTGTGQEPGAPATPMVAPRALPGQGEIPPGGMRP